jgi:hypothetical protein
MQDRLAALWPTDARLAASPQIGRRWLASGPKDLPLEQRREVRVTLDSPARIKALDPLTSLGPSATGQILNTSISGLKLKVPRAFVPGAVVQIRFQGQIVLGTVRYCIPLENEFFVGVHLKEEL